MKLWHHLVGTAMLDAVEDVVHFGWEVDSLRITNAADSSRLHIAEVLSRTAAGHGIPLPPEDARLMFRLRSEQVPIDLNRGGCLTATFTGELGWVLGDGTTIESTGPHLTHVLMPDPKRYRTQYRVPALTTF
jgi:hypothetical protein